MKVNTNGIKLLDRHKKYENISNYDCLFSLTKEAVKVMKATIKNHAMGTRPVPSQGMEFFAFYMQKDVDYNLIKYDTVQTLSDAVSGLTSGECFQLTKGVTMEPLVREDSLSELKWLLKTAKGEIKVTTHFLQRLFRVQSSILHLVNFVITKDERVIKTKYGMYNIAYQNGLPKTVKCYSLRKEPKAIYHIPQGGFMAYTRLGFILATVSLMLVLSSSSE